MGGGVAGGGESVILDTELRGVLVDAAALDDELDAVAAAVGLEGGGYRIPDIGACVMDFFDDSEEWDGVGGRATKQHEAYFSYIGMCQHVVPPIPRLEIVLSFLCEARSQEDRGMNSAWIRLTSNIRNPGDGVALASWYQLAQFRVYDRVAIWWL